MRKDEPTMARQTKNTPMESPTQRKERERKEALESQGSGPDAPLLDDPDPSLLEGPGGEPADNPPDERTDLPKSEQGTPPAPPEERPAPRRGRPKWDRDEPDTPRLHIHDVTFDTIRSGRVEALRRICEDNGVNAVGTTCDLQARLRAYKMGLADRSRERECPDCKGEGRPICGPRFQSHTVIRAFKCNACGTPFRSIQDTRKAGVK